MAMNLGFNTRKLFIGYDIAVPYDSYMLGFSGITGLWDNTYKIKHATSGIIVPNETQYIDLGIITDETEEYSSGGIPITLPGGTSANRSTWNIGMKILRVTISGIIPDGNYVDMNGDADFNGKSNSSIFRYKMNKLIAYQAFGVTDDTTILPGTVQYCRIYINETHGTARSNSGINSMTPGHNGIAGDSGVAKWSLVGYSSRFINGTRNLSYTISLELANNGLLTETITSSTLGISPKSFGDLY